MNSYPASADRVKDGPLVILKTLLRYTFGSFNGIQAFLFPGLLLYWLDSDRLVTVVSDLLALNIHYFPLCVFLLLGSYVAFILLKNRALNSGLTGSAKLDTGAFIVDLHKKLLIVLISFALLFILSGFFKYFYGIRIPVRTIASWTARVLGIGIILYYYLLHVWLAPWLKRGHSQHSSAERSFVYARLHPWRFVGFTLFQVIMIFVLARVYVNVLEYVYHPLFMVLGSATGIRIELKLWSLTSNLALFLDVFLAIVALMISNIFFIPLVWVAELSSRIMHPIRPSVTSNRTKELN